MIKKYYKFTYISYQYSTNDKEVLLYFPDDKEAHIYSTKYEL